MSTAHIVMCHIVWFQVLAVFLLALWCVSSVSAAAHLLASKSILNQHIAEGKDITVQYSIYNIGTR